MECTALLVIEFDVAVDRISRAMFDEKFASHGWRRLAGLAGAWTLAFERSSRESALRSSRSTLELALQGARINREQARAALHIGPEEPVPV